MLSAYNLCACFAKIKQYMHPWKTLIAQFTFYSLADAAVDRLLRHGIHGCKPVHFYCIAKWKWCEQTVEIPHHGGCSKAVKQQTPAVLIQLAKMLQTHRITSLRIWYAFTCLVTVKHSTHYGAVEARLKCKAICCSTISWGRSKNN